MFRARNAPSPTPDPGKTAPFMSDSVDGLTVAISAMTDRRAGLVLPPPCPGLRYLLLVQEARASMTGIKPNSQARVVTCSEPLSLFAHEFDFSSLRSRRTWLVTEGSLRIGEYILDQEKIEKREHEMCAPLRRGLVGAGRPPGGTPEVKEQAPDLERTDSPRFQNDRPGPAKDDGTPRLYRFDAASCGLPYHGVPNNLTPFPGTKAMWKQSTSRCSAPSRCAQDSGVMPSPTV